MNSPDRAALGWDLISGPSCYEALLPYHITFFFVSLDIQVEIFLKSVAGLCRVLTVLAVITTTFSHKMLKC